MKKRILYFSEQLIVSGANFLFIVYSAKKLPKEDFGALSLSITICLFLQGFVRAFSSLPAAVSVLTIDDLRQRGKPYVFANLILIFLCYVVLGLLFFILNIVGSGSYNEYIFSLKGTLYLFGPFVFYEFVRRLSLATEQILLCLGSAIVYGAIVGSLFLQNNLHVEGIIFFYSTANILASSVLVSIFRKTISSKSLDFYAEIKEIFQFGKWASCSHIAYSSYNQMIPLLLGALRGITDLATFNASRIFTQPLVTFLASVDNYDKSASARAFREGGYPSLIRASKKVRRVLMVFFVVYTLVIMLGYDVLAGFILNGEYEVRSETLGWFVVVGAMYFVQPIEAAITATKASKQIFQARLVASVVTLIFACTLIPALGVFGALASAAIGWISVLVFETRNLKKLAKKPLIPSYVD